MYNAPTIVELGSLADLTGVDGNIQKVGGGQDAFSQLSGLSGSITVINPNAG